MEKGRRNKKRGHFLRKALFLFSPLLSSIALTSCDLDGFFPKVSFSSEPSSSPSESNSSSSESSESSSSSSESSSSSSEPSSSSSDSSSENAKEGDFAEISFHFLTLGNQYNGDSIYIKAGENDILIDAGSKYDSASTLKSKIDEYCTDGKLEYVIATHGDQDHIAAFSGGYNNKSGILYQYKVDTLIDFPLTSKTTYVYQNYCTARDYAIKNGANHYTAKECYNETNGAQRTYTLGEGLSMSVLYQKYYDSLDKSCENNQSVCLLFKQGEKKMLFTGDLEESGCASLLANNDIGTVSLYKGGHHGSINANPDSFISSIKPETICTCCVAGGNEYTKNNDRTMPYQETINNWAKWTDDVYVTSSAVSTGVAGNIGKLSDLNGDIEVKYDKTGEKTVKGSASSKKLKDSDWMKNNRTMPENWK